MTLNHYDTELHRLGETYSLALTADVRRVKTAIAGASESSIIGVGSGGSFTVASLLCNLHETYTGRVSRPSTPLEIISSPTLASASPVFLISAEGKNPDIIEAFIAILPEFQDIARRYADTDHELEQQAKRMAGVAGE